MHEQSHESATEILFIFSWKKLFYRGENTGLST